MEQYFCCQKCGWTGKESELDFDDVETCFGDDQMEICPKCGSIEVIIKYSE